MSAAIDLLIRWARRGRRSIHLWRYPGAVLAAQWRVDLIDHDTEQTATGTDAAPLLAVIKALHSYERGETHDKAV